VTPGTADDRIWNGADDDGSGTVALMARRVPSRRGHSKRSSCSSGMPAKNEGSTGRGISRITHVALDKIVAQLNIDMIGRNRDDKKSEANTVYLVGSDRISSELDQLRGRESVAPTAAQARLRDERSADPEQVCLYCSDHYSYASSGFRSFSLQPVCIRITTRTPTT
jgi:Zn-dependent M28 family amino/carboxypeptidase